MNQLILFVSWGLVTVIDMQRTTKLKKVDVAYTQVKFGYCPLEA